MRPSVRFGKTVEFRETPDFKEAGIAALATDLNAGAVDTLVILGGNPVFNAPADLNWAATQRKAKTVVRLGYYEDETFAVSDLHLPGGAFSRIMGRCAHGGRHGRYRAAVDSAAVRRGDGT